MGKLLINLTWMLFLLLSSVQADVTVEQKVVAVNTSNNNSVIITEDPSPDYSPTLKTQGSIVSGAAGDIELLIRIAEYNGGVNSGDLNFTIVKNTNLVLYFDPSKTIQQGKALDNSMWILSQTSSQYVFTYIENSRIFPANSFFRVGLTATYYPSESTEGKFPLDVTIVGGTGEVETANNKDTDIIEYHRLVDIDDTIKPVITLIGNAEITLEAGENYSDAGATAHDDVDGDITLRIITLNPVNSQIPEDYMVTYNVRDGHGNVADQVTRTVHVVDMTKPTITLLGNAELTIEAGTVYEDAGAIADDNVDGDISANIVVNNPVNTHVVGEYNVIYNVSDSSGNTADQIQRMVHVVDTMKPVFISNPEVSVNENQIAAITLVASDETEVTYGISGIDSSSFNLNITTGVVLFKIAPDYEVRNTYQFTAKATDISGNEITQNIIVHILDVNETIMDANSSVYEEEVILPECDSANPEVQIIQTNDDWQHINDTNKRIFCVKPGDYSQERIYITSSGTATEKKYIILDNGNDTHSGKLHITQLAKVGFYFQNANYWVVDRMGYWESTSTLNPIVLDRSDHNIINRYFMHNVGNGIYLFPGSDNNTIQNCRIERDNIDIFHDRAAIGLYNDYQNNISIKNTKILNNEIYNFVDGFQTIRQNPSGTPNDNYEGTIVDHNHFYIDETIYTDCQGHADPSGDCAYAENAIDLKVGSENAENPMIISNNIMWGYRKSDQTNSYLSDPGAIMPIHYNVNHTMIKNNVSFNSTVGFSIADPYNGNAMRNASIDNNIFYDIKKYAIYIADSDAIEFTNNVFKNIHSLTYNAWFIGNGVDTNIDFSYNTVINTANNSATGHISSLSVLNNAYYQSVSGILYHESDTVYSEDPSINYDDFVFIADRYTAHPRQVRLPKVVRPTNETVEGVTANDDLLKTVVNRPIILYPYKNDTDSNGTLDLTSIQIILEPTKGNAVIDNNGTLIYMPNNGMEGNDTIKYKICDSADASSCDDATIFIMIDTVHNQSNEVKTQWGFKGFSVPNHTVTVNVGESVANAITNIKNQGGGTVILSEGTHYANKLQVPSNIVIKGVSRENTLLKIQGDGYLMLARDDNTQNIIVKDMTIDCTNNGNNNCIEFDYGVRNVLVENIHIFGATKSNIIAWNEHWSNAGAFTIRNNISHDAVNYHGIVLRFIKGAIVENNIMYKVGGHGIDMSRVRHGEVVNNSIIDTGYGTKFPGSDYLYMHDNYISGILVEGGIKFNPISSDYNNEHVHLENNIVKKSRGGIVDWGDDAPAAHFTEFVAKNNSVTEDVNGMNYIRVANGISLYDYGNDVRNRNGDAITDEFQYVIRKSAAYVPEEDGVGYTSWGNPVNSQNSVYKPALNFAQDDVYNNTRTVEVSTTSELQNAINSASPSTTILLNNGTYTNVNIEFPKGLHDITIKAKGNGAVIVPKGYSDNSAFTLPNVARISEQVYNINFVGLKIQGSTNSWKQFIKSVHGRWVDSGGGLHDYGADNPKYGPYNIYFYKIESENLFMGLYSGLYAHDWTMDCCVMKSSTYSHSWYMMGWHLGVINSVFEDATHDALAIRGYYPEDEVHTYIGKEDATECYGNRYVEERDSREVANGFLPVNEWTHTIRNNLFKRVTTIRNYEHAYVAIAYSVYTEDPICGAEKTYMPPQNVEIAYNTFNNEGEDTNARNHAVAVNARSGINNDTLSSINGVSIYNNNFHKLKESETFIMTEDSNTDLSDLNESEVHDNIVIF